MKTIYFPIGTLILALSVWYISINITPEAIISSEGSQKAANVEKKSAATVRSPEMAAIPRSQQHGGKTCNHDHCQPNTTSQLLADKRSQTWPAAVTSHLEKKYHISQSGFRHLSRAISYTAFEQLTEEQLQRVVNYAEWVQNRKPIELLNLCWGVNTPPVFRDAMDTVRALAIEENTSDEPQAVFQGDDRWFRTATDGITGSEGTPVTITWGFVADGTSISAASSFAAGTSNLIATLNATFGSSTTGSFEDAPWFELFETSFAYWSEVTGNTYIYVDYDDGVQINGSSGTGARGTLNVRPDVRIAGTNLDGNSGTLAYNYFPDAGDMVIDTNDSSNFTNSTTTKRRFRNVIAHEHGHGLGLSHVCPVNRTKLMEPSVTTTFTGVQFDEMITSQGIYGDFMERSGGSKNNDTIASANSLGTLSGNFQRDQLSISNTDDIDIYKFNVTSGKRLSVRIIPTTQAAYLEGEQLSNGCSAGTSFNPNLRQNLSIRVLAPDGSTVLASANSQPIGAEEAINDLLLPQSGQDYFIEVTGGGENSSNNNNAQVYSMILDVENASTLAGSDYKLTQEGCAPANLAIDPDETVTAQIRVTNSGATTISSPEVTISGSANFTAIGSSTKTLSSLAVGESATVSFQFSLSGDCGAEETLLFTMDSGSGVTSFSQIVNLGALINVLEEDFEASASMPSSLTASSNVSAALWQVSSSSPVNGTRSVFTQGSNNATSDLTTGNLIINGPNPTLTFSHFYDFENNFDGGSLEIKIGNGAWQEWTTAGGSFTANGYNGNLDDGSDVWTGDSNQTVVTTATLPASAIGATIQIRWRAEYDFSVISNGWRVDDISLSSFECCEGNVPVISVITSDDFALENDVANTGEFTITSSAAPATDLDVLYTLSGSATSGSDYIALSGTATISAGQQMTTIPVTAIRDSLIEGDETLTLTLSTSGNYAVDTNSDDLTIKDLPFDQWRDDFFGTSTLNIGDAEDFDFDGLANLIEYALGKDPTQSNPQLPSAILQNGGTQLTLTYQEDTSLTDIQYIVEVSPTLGGSPSPWTTSGVALTNGPLVDGKRTVTATANVSGVRQFMRLRVVRN